LFVCCYWCIREWLANMDILCTDKTGTLTEGKPDLNAYAYAEGKPSRHVLDLAAVNSYFQASLKSPMDAAIGVRISPERPENVHKNRRDPLRLYAYARVSGCLHKGRMPSGYKRRA